MRIVIEIGRNAQPGQVLNSLFKHTPMQSTFAANMVALHNGQPMTMGLKEALEHHIDFRREVIRRRTEFDLEKARYHRIGFVVMFALLAWRTGVGAFAVPAAGETSMIRGLPMWWVYASLAPGMALAARTRRLFTAST